MSQAEWCEKCGRMIGVGCGCGMAFAEKVRSVRLDPSATPTREKVAYYDRAALSEAFGEDRQERYLDDTEGLGAAYSGRGGSLWRYDRRDGEVVRVDRKLEDSHYLGGRDEEHG